MPKSRLRREGVGFEVFEIHEFQGRNVAGLEDHFRGASCLQCFLPALDAETPTVSVFETGEQVIWAWSAKVVSSGFGEGEKIGSDYGADGMQSPVFGARSTVAIAIKAGEWGGAAALQIGAKNVGAHENRGVFWKGVRTLPKIYVCHITGLRVAVTLSASAEHDG